VIKFISDRSMVLLTKVKSTKLFVLLVCLLVFNATFNNSSVISWRSVLLVEETGGPGENHRSVTDKLCEGPYLKFGLYRFLVYSRFGLDMFLFIQGLD
jgi:hypothetical protein